MAFTNPSDSSEILYGSSGDVRNEINAYVPTTTAGHYSDENEIPGQLIINSLRKATRIINGFLEPVYADQIPFTATADVPKLLDEIASDVAVCYLWRSAHAFMGRMPEDKREDYCKAYLDPDDGMLAQIRDRKIQLSELTSVYADDVKAIRGGHTAVFDLDSDTSQRVDPDLLDDIERDRR